MKRISLSQFIFSVTDMGTYQTYIIQIKRIEKKGLNVFKKWERTIFSYISSQQEEMSNLSNPVTTITGCTFEHVTIIIKKEIVYLMYCPILAFFCLQCTQYILSRTNWCTFEYQSWANHCRPTLDCTTNLQLLKWQI